MQQFTATYKDGCFLFTNNYSEEIGTLNITNNSKVIFYNGNENIQFNISKNMIEVFKNEKKIDNLEKTNSFKNLKSTISEVKIKGISSWKGGTQLIDNKDRTLATLNNQSALFDNGVYKFETFFTIEPYQLALMLYLHLKGSKIKTTMVIAVTFVFATLYNIFK